MYPKFIRINRITYSMSYFNKCYSLGKDKYRKFCLKIDGKMHSFEDVDGELQVWFEMFIDHLDEDRNCWGTCFDVDHFFLKFKEEKKLRDIEFEEFCKLAEKESSDCQR